MKFKVVETKRKPFGGEALAQHLKTRPEQRVACPKCKGEGTTDGKECPTCKGWKRITITKEQVFTGSGSIAAPSAVPQNPLQAVGADGQPTIALATPEMKKKAKRKKQIKTIMVRRPLPKV